MKYGKVIAITAIAVAALSLAGCTSTDTVGKFAVKSFESLETNLGESVQQETDTLNWSLLTPNAEKVTINSDFSSPVDIVMTFDATPFIKAGLAPENLDSEVISLDSSNNILSITSELGSENPTNEKTTSMTAVIEGLVKNYRDRIGYHSKLDHYGISLDGGNMLEWAKDLKTNDKDLVLVLNPEPFIAAGVDPNAVEGWIYAEVEMMDENDKPFFEYKFLKPYNIAD